MDSHEASVTVFWRPNCPFCTSLLRGLEGKRVAFDRVNIWEDADAASYVRSVASGNETVPTVVVSGVAMVNPTVQQVMFALDPETSSEWVRPYQHLPLRRLLVGLLIVAGFSADGLGHTGAAWLLEAGALVAYGALRAFASHKVA